MLQQLAFFGSIAFSVIAWGIVAVRYIWPELRFRQGLEALRPLLILHAFRFIGLAFLVNAFYEATATGLSPGQLGATYFIPTLIVPLLLITHGLAFRLLLQHQGQPAMRESRQPA